jgi:hypothetical protein
MLPGENVTGGHRNTLLGLNAGASITTGCCNVVMGQNSGYCITTGNHNIFLGADTGPTANSSNKIVIGKSATATNNDSNDEIVIGNGIGGFGGQTFTFGKASNRVYNVFTSNASWTRSSDLRLKRFKFRFKFYK